MRRLVAAGLALVALMVATPAVGHHTPVDRHPYHRTTGAYAIWGDDRVAGLNGYTYGVAQWSTAYADEGVAIADNAIQQFMYHTFCDGWGNCPDYTPANEQRVLDYAAAYVQQHRANPDIIGWYLVDDPWTDFSPTLTKLAGVIRTYDAVKPMVCALQLDLKSSIEPDPLVQFRQRTSDNFSPDWCDVFTVYSYAEAGATNVEWSMDSTLPQAIAYLRSNKGLTATNSKQLGTPQAFGGVGFATPTRVQLARQVRNFCEKGATGILAYAWDDRVVGRAQLANSFELRQGMRDGIADCLW